MKEVCGPLSWNKMLVYIVVCELCCPNVCSNYRIRPGISQKYHVIASPLLGLSGVQVFPLQSGRYISKGTISEFLS